MIIPDEDEAKAVRSDAFWICTNEAEVCDFMTNDKVHKHDICKCPEWCNIKSVRNAIRSGFRPAWVEITAKDRVAVDEMNRRDG